MLLIVAGPSVMDLVTKIIWTLWKHYVKPKIAKTKITFNEIRRVKSKDDCGGVNEVKTSIS